MEVDTMGKVMVAAKIQNLQDLYDCRRGMIREDQVRTVEVPDALVDTGATTLSMPRHLITRLGIQPFRTRQAQTSAGLVSLQIHEAVRLTVQGRDCLCDVAELPDGCPILIGQIPLEALDFVVDLAGRRLIGNPAHGGEHMIELY
jgi:predicted aspartyl protease